MITTGYHHGVHVIKGEPKVGDMQTQQTTSTSQPMEKTRGPHKELLWLSYYG